MIIQTVNNTQFRQAFYDAGRGSQFSDEGLDLLFDFLSDLEGHHELDVIGLCCDFCEDDYTDIAEYLGIELTGDTEDDMEIVRVVLDRHTFVVGTTDNNTIVYQCY